MQERFFLNGSGKQILKFALKYKVPKKSKESEIEETMITVNF